MLNPRTETAPQSLPPAAAAPAQAVRMFGRFQLLRLIGKSTHTMLWLVNDARQGQDLMLAIPRVQPADPAAMQQWQSAVQRTARLDHPSLARVVEAGEHDRWPYAAFERGKLVTLAETLSRKGIAAVDVGRWCMDLLSGLAFAHEAGVAHRDIQPFMITLDEQGRASLLGLEVAHPSAEDLSTGDSAGTRQAHRSAIDRDLLAFGLLMHHALAGVPALGEADAARVMERLPPTGRDFVRLPWDVPQPIPEPLRAIVNRATDRQQRHRYHAARTLRHALEGWLDAQTTQDGGPLAHLLQRIGSVGLLPATPGATNRAARLALMDRERTSELAEVVLEDIALSVELLRMVNGARLRDLQLAGTDAVLTVRRAIAMLGMDGVRRAALALRAWPGPLDTQAAERLEQVFARSRRAGRLAQALRPAGYDEEVVYLVALLQDLGTLMLWYHFPDEAQQIERLMQPERSSKLGQPDEPGMDHQAASFAVLGIDMEELGVAVARHLGFADEMIALLRRLPVTLPVRSDQSDAEILRAVASCAHEVAAALAQPSARPAMDLHRVAVRYGRLLGLALDDIMVAVKGGRAAAPLPAATPQDPMQAPTDQAP